jgi:hypothetical protein
MTRRGVVRWKRVHELLEERSFRVKDAHSMGILPKRIAQAYRTYGNQNHNEKS